MSKAYSISTLVDRHRQFFCANKQTYASAVPFFIIYFRDCFVHLEHCSRSAVTKFSATSRTYMLRSKVLTLKCLFLLQFQGGVESDRVLPATVPIQLKIMPLLMRSPAAVKMFPCNMKVSR